MASVPAWPDISLAHWRYARLVSPLNDDSRHALAERLKLPRAVEQLARHSATTARLLGDLTEQEALAPERVFGWLEGLDAWRKPEQVAAQLALVEALAPTQQSTLERAWQAAAAVSPQALMAEGYKGAALGQQIRISRAEAVAQALA
jgi:tRNA nucleotidyltransferase (CCA-adding enzyme)